MFYKNRGYTWLADDGGDIIVGGLGWGGMPGAMLFCILIGGLWKLFISGGLPGTLLQNWVIKYWNMTNNNQYQCLR